MWQFGIYVGYELMGYVGRELKYGAGLPGEALDALLG